MWYLFWSVSRQDRQSISYREQMEIEEVKVWLKIREGRVIASEGT